jgi:hypothetical protein
VDGVALLGLLLGRIAFWATPATNLHGKDEADAVNATRQVLLAVTGGLVLLTVGFHDPWLLPDVPVSVGAMR